MKSNLTKKVIDSVEESEQEKEVKRQRAIIKEQVYPLLLSDSLNIEDAKQMVYATSMAIKQAFNNMMLQMGVWELEMKTKVDDKPENERFKKLLDIFSDEKITTAISLLEGTQSAIESFQREEAFKRKLETLPADLL